MNLNTIRYNCTTCGNPEILNITGKLSENRHRLISKCFDNKICMTCYCSSPKSLKETAENIVALMCE